MTTEGQLFGSVRRLPVIGNLPVPTSRLRGDLPSDDYGLFFFCSGCGTVLPVLKTAVQEIAGEKKDSYDGQYIATKRCDLCEGQFQEAHLAEIPMDS